MDKKRTRYRGGLVKKMKTNDLNYAFKKTNKKVTKGGPTGGVGHRWKGLGTKQGVTGTFKLERGGHWQGGKEDLMWGGD